jgi:hypothetical protein
MKIVGNKFPMVINLLSSSISLDDPFIRRFIDTFITANFTNEFLQENMSRVSLQEIPDFTGHRLETAREVQRKDVDGDAELGIVARAKDGEHAT